MPIDTTSIAALVASTLEDYAKDEPILLHKYDNTGTTDTLYKQRARKFSLTDIEVFGHVSMRITPDVATAIGKEDEEFAGRVTFSRTEVMTKTALAVRLAITDKDQITLNGVRYRIVKVHYSGILVTDPEVIIVYFDSIHGVV